MGTKTNCKNTKMKTVFGLHGKVILSVTYHAIKSLCAVDLPIAYDYTSMQ